MVLIRERQKVKHQTHLSKSPWLVHHFLQALPLIPRRSRVLLALPPGRFARSRRCLCFCYDHPEGHRAVGPTATPFSKVASRRSRSPARSAVVVTGTLKTRNPAGSKLKILVTLEFILRKMQKKRKKTTSSTIYSQIPILPFSKKLNFLLKSQQIKSIFFPIRSQ